jgi:hypothetical protein
MTLVLPYGIARNLRGYLDAAHKQGLKVVVELDRRAVASGDTRAIARWVDASKRHPAVYAWYLADEPMLARPFVSPIAARRAYLEIKARDPGHPVAIAFGIKEDAMPYRDAMDVMMYDDYPCTAHRKEFTGFRRWWERIRQRASVASGEDGFIPILQAFGEDRHGIPQYTKRLPTARELRYMAFASLQSGATGLLFWVRYRSRRGWVDSTLVPIVREIRKVGQAMGDVGSRRAARHEPDGVLVTSFHDARTGEPITVAVNHSDKPVNASYDVEGRRVGEHLRPYEVRVYEPGG